MPALHPFFPWRFRWLFVTPVAAALLSLVLVVAGSPSPREQLRRLGAYPQGRDGAPTLGAVLSRIADGYIDPGRIDPRRMVEAAVTSMEQMLPECISRRDGAVLHLRCAEKEVSADLERIRDVAALHETMQKFLAILPPSLSGAEAARVRFAVINAMLGVLDPHTALLDPDVYRELKTGTQGSFSGVGIVVTVRDGYLTVIAPMDGTPAARAGIRPGDRIVRIGDVSVTNTSLAEAVNYLRGKPGTSVSVWVERENESQWLHFTLERSVIHLSSVTSSLLPGAIGYVRIRQFSQNTARELRTHLEKLAAQDARALILDLSNNPGGLLTQAERGAALFLSERVVFSVLGQNRRIEDVRRTPPGAFWQKPMVVLVNSGSASAAEILAGALKVQGRALVMGETSFGKGSIQIIHEFEDDSALKMTIAHYLAGGELPIHARGVKPHVQVQVLEPDEHPFQQPSTDSPRSEEGGFANVAAVEDVSWASLQVAASRPEAAFDDMDTQAPPEVIDAARRLLLDWGEKAWNAAGVRAWCEAESIRAQSELVAQLGRKGIDWSLGETDFSKVKLDAKLQMNAEGGQIRAGEPLAGVLTLHNLGTSPVYRIAALVRVGPDTAWREYLAGRLDPGEHRTIAFSVPVPVGHPLAAWPVSIRFLCLDARSGSQRDFLPPDMKHWVRIQPPASPNLQVHYHFMDDGVGNGDGLLQPGERGRLRLYVRNAGAERVDAMALGFRVPAGSGMEIVPSRVSWSRLLPQESQVHDFLVHASEKAEPSDASPLFFIELRASRRLEVRLPLHVAAMAPGPVESTGLFQVNAESPLSACAGQDWAFIGIAGKGSSFAVLGTQGQWVKVQLAPDRTAFVARNAGTLVSPEAVPLLSPRWSPVWQVVQPSIDVLTELPLRTKDAQAPLAVRLFHPWRLMDAEVEVYGEKSRYVKVLFVPGENRSELHIAPMVPLFPGKNRVVVSVRSTPELQNRWEQHVYREP